MKVVKPLDSGAKEQRHGPDAARILAGWVALGLSRAECLMIEESNFQELVAHADSVHSWSELAAPGIDAIMVLSPDVAPLFPQSASTLFHSVPWQDLWVTVLLPWQEPPTRCIRADGVADSFCCSAEVFRNLLNIGGGESSDRLCFELLDAILNGQLAVQRLVVRQLPVRDVEAAGPSLPQNAALIMAHRGPKQFLTSALRFVTSAASNSQVKVRVGLDVDDVGEYRSLSEVFPAVEFYGVDKAPVGPYVIRQRLIDLSTEHFIVFHDSDDISCHDRFARQTVELTDTHVEAAGSHELRVDELTGTVEVYRFPLDATAALALPGSTEQNDRANEPLLHPTLTMLRSGFLAAGGFSTNRKIANDTQFMLRAYFSLRMRNVDSFLYIRRRHSSALTVEKRTALGSSLRHFLGSTWGADFEAVKNGKARLEETSLWARLEPVPHQLKRLWAAERLEE
jgi:hypothetical protein